MSLLTATFWFSPGKAELVWKEMLAFYFYGQRHNEIEVNLRHLE